MAIDTLEGIADSFLPFPDVVSWNSGDPQKVQLSFCQKVQYVAAKVFQFFKKLFILPFACVYSMGKYAVTLFKGKTKETPIEGPADASVLPEHFGFADSLFQTSGLGTEHSATKLEGVADWGDGFMSPKTIEGTEDRDYKKFFVDVLGNPDPYIDLLKKQNVSAHRFSMEWAVMQPEKGGPYNKEAIQKYANFIHKLKEAGIEPYVTLHHFVCPKWFKEIGGFEKRENIALYKKYALDMMREFKNVTHWMPFNEINVDGFQKLVRGVYPPARTGDIAGCANMMRNMLMAHCLVYQEAKKMWPELQIGSSHQWINFEPLEGNPLERAICYYLSKITHYACYNFFKTGKFTMDIPVVANVQMEIPAKEFQENNRFSDFMGVQFYGYPRLKAGFNGWHEYPGYKINNVPYIGLTFGSTCPRGGEAMSFGPGFYPESLDKCLKEAVAIGKPLVISETGCDARVQRHGDKDFRIDNEVQKRYFEKIFPILAKYKEHLKGFFAWTLIRSHLEWDRGAFPQLGMVNILKDKNRNIIGAQASPAAELLQKIYGEARQREEEGLLLHSS